MATVPNNTAPAQQPFLAAVCHNVRPERFVLLTDEEMRAYYEYGLAHQEIWTVRPEGAELAYIRRLGLSSAVLAA